MIRKSEYLSDHPALHAGMDAYNPFGEKLGKVERLDEDGFTIEKGWLFPRDISVHYDDIREIGQDEVVVDASQSQWQGRRGRSVRGLDSEDVQAKERTALRQEAGIRTTPQPEQRDAGGEIRK